MNDWQKILKRFGGVRVLIIGDVMLDRYWWGTVSRVSPEAPVPVVKLERVTASAGGAANVAANVAALGADPILIGAIGDDEGGKLLPEILAGSKVGGENLICLNNRPTTTKTRIVAHQQHVVRIDDEAVEPLDATNAEKLWRRIEDLLPAADVVVLSDYAKGCLCDSILSDTIAAACRAGKPVLIDPKGKSYRKYSGATILTPNKIEAAAAAAIEINDLASAEIAGRILLEQIELESLLITLGEDGMLLFKRNQKTEHFPAQARKVYDVTGAGDTVIATLAVALGAKTDLATAARLANTAAGLAVEQIGTATVTQNLLQQTLQEIEF